MIPAAIPPDEAERLVALQRYGVLDTAPEARFDRITSLAQRLFEVPIVLVSLVDANRQWFKSCIGLAVSETGRDESFCAHAILEDQVLVIPDTHADPRFADNPLVTGEPHIRFYAGAPLRTSDGLGLGTLCIIDQEPRSPLDTNEQATLVDLAAIVVDELELRHALGRAREAEQTATTANLDRDRMLSRMSHELRTPMNAVLGFADLLAMEDLEPDARESVAHIQDAGRSLLQLIDELLDLARVDAGELQLDVRPVEVREPAIHARDLLSATARERSVEIRVADACEAVVLADPDRLGQVLVHLVTHALDRTPPGERVAIDCAATDSGHVRVSVGDRGEELSAADRDRLFVAFEQLEPGSKVPLGLTLSQRLIAAMGGRVGVDERPGGGICVWLELATDQTSPDQPAAGAVGTDAAGSDQQQAARASGPPRRRVLYVEDDPANQQLVRQMFQMRPDVDLEVASGGGQALAVAQSAAPDLVLLDLGLADLPGEEVLRELVDDDRTKGVPVVVVSGERAEDHAQRLQEAGAAAFVTKPFQIRDLLALVDDLLEGS